MSARSRYKKQPRAIRRQIEAKITLACEEFDASLREFDRRMERLYYQQAGLAAVQEYRQRVGGPS